MSGIVYKKPAAELLQFANEDIITTSIENWQTVADWDTICFELQGEFDGMFRINKQGGKNSNGASEMEWEDENYRYGWTCTLWHNGSK